MLKTGLRDSGLRNYLRRVPPNSVLYLPGLDYGNWYTDTIKDYSGQANHGTIYGATPVRLPSGLWCLDFDGTDDRVRIAEAPSIEITGNIAVMCWVKIDATVTGNPVMIGKFDTVTPVVMSYYLNYSSATGIANFYSGGTAAGNNASIAVSTGTWLHIVGIYDGATKIFVNGELKATATTPLAPKASPGSNLFIGIREDLTDDFLGLIGEVRIYNRALTPLEIQNNFIQTRWRYR